MNKWTCRTLVTIGCLATWAQAADVAVALKPGELDVLIDGKVATRYMHAYDKSTPQRLNETYKPFLHVFDEQGKRPITNGAGGEYPHHRGIFIGWNKTAVGGQGGKTFDRWHMKGGEIVHQRFSSDGANVDADAGTVTFTAINHWNDDQEKPFLLEERTHVVRVGPKPWRMTIDFTSKLTAQDQDVTLGGDPEHAGIHYRPANDVDRAKTLYVYSKADARPHEDVDYDWVAQQYTLKDGDTVHSVVQMNHPDNPKGTKWSAYRNYGRFGAFPTATIKAGQSLTLKYRFLVADREMPTLGDIEANYFPFAGRVPEQQRRTTRLPAEQPKPRASANETPVKP